MGLQVLDADFDSWVVRWTGFPPRYVVPHHNCGRAGRLTLRIHATYRFSSGCGYCRAHAHRLFLTGTTFIHLPYLRGFTFRGYYHRFTTCPLWFDTTTLLRCHRTDRSPRVPACPAPYLHLP